MADVLCAIDLTTDSSLALPLARASLSPQMSPRRYGWQFGGSGVS